MEMEMIEEWKNCGAIEGIVCLGMIIEEILLQNNTPMSQEAESSHNPVDSIPLCAICAWR